MIGAEPSTATAPQPANAQHHEQDPTVTSTTAATTTTTTQCEQVPRALCTIHPAPPPSSSSSPSPPPVVVRSETPEDVMLQDCLQALSTLKQGVSTPRMVPTEPSTVGGIVPPVGVNAKKPRKMRIPRNALAGPDHPRTPSGSGRRRTVTSDDPAKASGTCCSAAPVPVASTKTHRKSHSGGLSILLILSLLLLLCCVCNVLVVISSVVRVVFSTEI